MSAPKWDGLILARNGALDYKKYTYTTSKMVRFLFLSDTTNAKGFAFGSDQSNVQRSLIMFLNEMLFALMK